MNREAGTDILFEVRNYLLGRLKRGSNILYRTEKERAHAESTKDAGSFSGSAAETAREDKGEGYMKRDHEAEKEVKVENGIRYSERGPSQDTLFEERSSGSEDKLGELDFEGLKLEVSSCARCGLSEKRTNTVFGAGGTSSGIVFLGEAPGKNEDLQGEPFVGRAGKLLDKILRAIDLERDEVFITNILKCRPPGNRDPKEDEISACEPYLRRQLELLNPAVICALGRVAAQNLLRSKTPLGKMRGQIHYYNGIKTIVTYHPAALLRNPHFKRPTWEDMKLLKTIYSEAKEKEL
ncbi:MAG: uracil-DNA glycosylase [Candidatus Krumholzibacteriota bacterium]|nr:uracil-DNA glycosylase [Candidatus Krumholzibacteriota bacterium]